MSEPIVPVVFRKWPKSKGGGILALFPTLPATHEGFLCDSFEHVGQHCAADYKHCVSATFPAKPEEYEGLKKELSGHPYNYNLKVVKRCSDKMWAERYSNAK